MITRSEVIVLTNKHTQTKHKQTEAAENTQRSSLYATTLGKNTHAEVMFPGVDISTKNKQFIAVSTRVTQTGL